MQANKTWTSVPEDAKSQNSSPIFSSCITAPIFYLPAAGWRLPAGWGWLSLPTPASMASTSLEAPSRWGFIVTCSSQAWCHGSSHSSSFGRPPASQLCPKEGQPCAGWRTAITTCGICSWQAETTSHSPRFSMRLLRHRKRSSALESRRDVVYHFTSIVPGMPQSNLKYHQLNH